MQLRQHVDSFSFVYHDINSKWQNGLLIPSKAAQTHLSHYPIAKPPKSPIYLSLRIMNATNCIREYFGRQNTKNKTGNPARRCRLSFCSKIDQNSLKIKYGVNKAVKLDFFIAKAEIGAQRRHLVCYVWISVYIC